MAGSGLVFVGYVLMHMYGNLKTLAGEEAFNTYAHHLRTFGEPILPYEGLLWIVRVVLIVAVIGHVYAAFALWSRAGTARRTKYAAAKTAMRTAWMRWGGVFLILFIVWHLLHFTIMKISVNPDAQGRDLTSTCSRGRQRVDRTFWREPQSDHLPGQVLSPATTRFCKPAHELPGCTSCDVEAFAGSIFARISAA